MLTYAEQIQNALKNRYRYSAEQIQNALKNHDGYLLALLVQQYKY